MMKNNLSMDIISACFSADKLSIAIVDTTGHYLYVSPYWMEMTGIKSSDIIFHKLFTYHMIPGSYFDEVLHTKKPLFGQPLMTPDTGGVVYANYYPLFGEDHKLLGAMVLTFLNEQRVAMELSKKVEDISGQLKTAQKYIKDLEMEKYSIDQITGKSECIKTLKEEIRLAAKNNSNVLIEGESGSGKELVANAIHGLSMRKDKRFIRVNCSAIPESLAESELFGYESGAFTGASKNGKPGKFELADKGSLFLDEIGQLPLTTQPKLLRVLQDHEVTRVGGTHEVPIDARIIAATNVSLRQLVTDGKFRLDLYYRLNVFHIHVPPLRDRKGDIPELISTLVARLNRRLGTNIHDIDAEVITRFKDYHWPGNIRELQNILEASIDRSNGHRLKIENLVPFDSFDYHLDDVYNPVRQTVIPGYLDLTAEQINAAIKNCGGNKTKAAKMLGISRATLYNKLKHSGNEIMD